MSTNKYLILKEQLEKEGIGEMTCFGNSMMPILKSGSKITFRAEKEYKIGDFVFCKVDGRFIDCHKITKQGSDGRFMIANNHGHENGWASAIYGRAIRAVHGTETKEF